MAHPHAGGENKPISDNMSLMKGSSPRGRGKPGRVARGVRAGGLIPARSGKTCWDLRLNTTGQAHPRAVGENSVHRMKSVAASGSSPRGRGKLDALARVGAGDGLIPARAGKTVGLRYAFRSAQAHPRAGGENRRPPPFHRGKSGSSPRGRGKLRIHPHNAHPHGLIPARAGKTSDPQTQPHPSRAHPRAGGENRRCSNPRRRDAGSSPRGRGKRGLGDLAGRVARLIPARAGKTDFR